jgi:hypothetical protein
VSKVMQVCNSYRHTGYCWEYLDRRGMKL